MKKLMSIAVVLIVCVAAVSAQVPSDITDNFNAQNPGVANPTWTVEGDYYRVNYSDSLNRESSILYDRDGNIFRRQVQLHPAEVPSNISDYYTKTFPSEKNFTIRREVDRSGNTIYHGSTTTGDKLYFDSEGKFVRKSPGANTAPGTGPSNTN